MNAKIITIGDELLIGQVIDSNSAWLASELEKINVKVTEIRSIPDEDLTIKSTLRDMMKDADIILISGGLGPTKDDVTKKALAEFMGVDMVFHEKSYEWLKKLFSNLKYEIRESHKSQCFVPSNCMVIPNKMGTAQGMWFDFEGKIIISMPGVPYEMKYIMQHGGLQGLTDLIPEQKIFHKTIMTAGWGETMIEEKINDLLEASSDNIKVAYLPGLGKVRVRVSCFSNSGSEKEAETLVGQIVDRLGNIVYGYDDLSLEQAIGNLCKSKNLQLGTAESCTGGHLSSLITKIPGSSQYYKGSVIAYSNEVKMNLLNVPEKILIDHGAVSEETVKAMVRGAINHLDLDVAIATSGIAGPTGGSPEKPVGTIWIACGNRKKQISRLLHLTKNRVKNIEYTSIAGLNLMRKFLTAE